MSAIRLLVYEDNPAMAESIASLIQQFPRIQFLGNKPNANHIVDDIRELNPQVVLLDINMPGINGIQAARLCKQAFPEVNLIMQTVFEDDDNIFNSILAGASGYILKKNLLTRLEQSIYDVHSGGCHLSPGIARKVLHFLSKKSNSKSPTKASEVYKLSEREVEVLELMVRGLSYKMIADQLNLSYYTINSHVRRIFTKLHVHSMSEAIYKSHNEGLI